MSARTAQLRRLLCSPDILMTPCCYDGLSSRLIEAAGFQAAFMSGFCTSAARLGAPDAGLLSYAEMTEQARCCVEATAALPIIGDGDTGYGNAMNVKRTVRGYAAAGLSGILLEDQEWPKSCGHVGRKRVVGREEALARVRAACDARDEGSGIVVIARSDARQAVGLSEALHRAAAFAEAGADVVFVDALESDEEMTALCGVAGVVKMANMLEGGRTPILPPHALQAMGFGIVAYPLSLLGVCISGMQQALQDLKGGHIPAGLPSFQEIQGVVGFPEYFREADHYKATSQGAVGSP